MDLVSLRQKFLDYFQESGYDVVPPSPLVPQNDPSVLFTTAGMQQFKPFYTHPSDAPAPQVATVQPVIRTSDIAEVGDDTHLTSFEMLGNFRFGEKSSMAMKKVAIDEAWRFVRDELGVSEDRVYVTVFGGDKEIPADTESEGIWQVLGVKDIRRAAREDNFWGPTGDEGPCGPTTEIYIDGVEVWNLVFNEYHCDRDGKFAKLDTPGVDTGSGLERLSATLQGKNSVWEIEPFKSWVESIGSSKRVEARVIIDHLRAIVFLVSSDITPANKGREYVLRRLIRKAIFLGSNIAAELKWQEAVNQIRTFYGKTYELKSATEIMEVFGREKSQFESNMTRAKGYLDKWLASSDDRDEKKITELAFYMYESFGFPKEMVLEHLISLGWKVDAEHFAKLFSAHQEVSRAGLDKQFKGGLADHEEKTIQHHTAHHLLLAALRQVLGESVVQRGSNVTSDRLRIDFAFDRKLTDEELKKVEQIVNEKIKADMSVVCEEMDKEAALKSGALAEFGQKYGDKVTVYKIGDFSKELCGGPHVKRTGELGKFEIVKEEASSQGVRRIKAKCLNSSG
ncbi:MAG: alanine--tRNA ligase [Candidatus Berkelbacteria bacterium]|nr:MAG: alanine--tRNA ligase [Candidatus Berkelbacteria bacterium]QQG51886.1 MAG: alanine--tRNA ligase [Candidatus Berkelbacteria bacterium]